MSEKAIIQYLQMMKQSGIDQLYRGGIDRYELLNELKNKYANCTKCALAEGRTNLVYGEGDVFAKAMIIGEAPGENEDRTGRPFVGAAGKLLDNMLAAIKISREEVYIANIVKCRPPGNRNPEMAERQSCIPYLMEQIEIIKPQIFLIMGLVAAQSLFENSNTLGWHRENKLELMGKPAFVTYHPAALIRNPNWKRPAWEDLQAFQKVYESLS